MKELIDALYEGRMLSKEQFARLIEEGKPFDEYLFEKARIRANEVYGRDIYIRGLIEISNYCRCDCLYCGIRRSNSNVARYRLSKEEILACCDMGYELGFRTFVMQGGEDLYYTDERICDIIRSIKAKHPDCAVTLSIGEKDRASYEAYREAGCDRYLLRHETAAEELYRKLHPKDQTMANRMRCLHDLKDLGFQVGAGMMLEAPYQKTEDLCEDLYFLKDLDPDMIGIGPFIPHHDTPFRDFKAGTLELTLRMIAILRLMFPYALIPATTALGTIDPMGREKGILAGANVVMPNLSPEQTRKLYMLYDNKMQADTSHGIAGLKLTEEMKEAGYKIVVARGDVRRNHG